MHFPSVMVATVAFSAIQEILLMRLYMMDVGFEPVLMRRRRLALRCSSSLPTALPKLPLKNGFEGPGELKITGRISAINQV